MSKYVPLFIKKLAEFLDQLEDRFPREGDIGLLKTTVDILRKTHPETLVEKYLTFVYPYKNAIDNEDEDFFLTSELTNIIQNSGDTQTATFKIDYFRSLFKKKDIDTKTKDNIWLYLKLLNTLCSKILEQSR
jgi:hypothetical protein